MLSKEDINNYMWSEFRSLGFRTRKSRRHVVGARIFRGADQDQSIWISASVLPSAMTQIVSGLASSRINSLINNALADAIGPTYPKRSNSGIGLPLCVHGPSRYWNEKEVRHKFRFFCKEVEDHFASNFDSSSFDEMMKWYSVSYARGMAYDHVMAAYYVIKGDLEAASLLAKTYFSKPDRMYSDENMRKYFKCLGIDIDSISA